MKDRKNIIVLLILVLGIFMMPRDVEATPICLKSTKSKYELSARKAKFTYSLVRDEYGEAYYKINVTNLDSSLVVKDSSHVYSSTDGSAIQLMGRFEPENEYTFKIFTADGLYECGNAYLVSKTISLPYYNSYSERSECVEYEEFPLCGVHYKGVIESNEDFDNQLKEWLKLNQNEVEEYKDERNLIQIFIDFYNDNLQISVIITIILGLLVLALIIRGIIRRFKRSKINI